MRGHVLLLPRARPELHGLNSEERNHQLYHQGAAGQIDAARSGRVRAESTDQPAAAATILKRKEITVCLAVDMLAHCTLDTLYDFTLKYKTTRVYSLAPRSATLSVSRLFYRPRVALAERGTQIILKLCTEANSNT